MSDAQGARRSELCAVHWLSVMWMGLIMYGSWLPFEFDGTFLAAHTGTLLSCFHFGAPGLEDAVTNVIVYVPLGALMAWSAVLAGAGVWRRVVIPLAVAVTVAAISESGQVLLPGRVASYTDMLCNAAGALLGIAAGPVLGRAWLRGGDTLRKTFAVRPMKALLWLGVGLVVFAKLAPFDVAVLPEDLRASLRDARWVPLAPAQASADDSLLENVVDVAGSFFAFVMLGILGALAHREAGDGRRWSTLAAIFELGFVAVAIETLQLLVCSHTCDMADVLTYLAGAGVGACLGPTAVERAWQLHADGGPAPQRPNAALRMLLGIAMMVQVSMIVAYALPDGQDRWVAPSIDSIQWLPFYAHFETPFALGVGRIVSSTMWYLALAALAVMMVPSRSAAYSLTMCAFLTVGVVTITEVMQAFTVSRYADVTEPLLALLAAIIATLVYRRLLDWQRAREEGCVEPGGLSRGMLPPLGRGFHSTDP